MNPNDGLETGPETITGTSQAGGQEATNQVPAISLFLSFLRLGLTAFGGPAMVAYIRDLAVNKKQWISKETFEDGVPLCQSIPGATAMQAAAYVGLRAGGPLGALAAFVGFGLPAFLLMIVLSAAYQEGHDLQPVLSAFRGLQVIVIALIANAALNFGRSSLKNWRDAILAASAAVYLALHGSPIVTIVASAALSAVLYRGVGLPAKAAGSAGQIGNRRGLRFAALLAGLVVVGLIALFMMDRRLLDLALLMMKIDVFAFGGGFASVPLMLHQIVDMRHWLDSHTFIDGIALGQVTPGPIVITATFVGYLLTGVAGAVVGTIAVFTPSFLMVLVTVPYFDRLQQSPTFRRALRGILASFVGLLAAVAVQFGTAVGWSTPAVLIAAAAFTALRLKIDILWVVLAGAAVSVFVL